MNWKFYFWIGTQASFLIGLLTGAAAVYLDRPDCVPVTFELKQTPATDQSPKHSDFYNQIKQPGASNSYRK